MTDQPKTSLESSKDASDAPEREILMWELFGKASRGLTEQTVAPGWIPDLITVIARGGLIPAGAASHAIGVKACGTMNAELYTGVGQTLEESQFLPPLMDVSAMNGRRVLIVDDVADSGKTLKIVMDLAKEYGLSFDGETQMKVGVRYAVIYKKPASVIEPDRVWCHIDRWINFPWLTLPTITA